MIRLTACKRAPWAIAAALALAAIALVLVRMFQVQAAKTHYRGFTFDEWQVRDRPERSAMRAAAKNQILIVNSLNLAPELMSFFRRVTIVLVPDEILPPTGRGELSGAYFQGRNTIVLPLRMISRMEEPILIHELLHAFHHRRLPEGIGNSEVRAHFRRTAAEGRFSDTPMMKNEAEFFAHSATAFLAGRTMGAPYSRANLQNHLPEWSAFLGSVFEGPASR